MLFYLNRGEEVWLGEGEQCDWRVSCILEWSELAIAWGLGVSAVRIWRSIWISMNNPHYPQNVS